MHAYNTAHAVDVGLIVEVVQVAPLQSYAVSVVEVVCLAAAAESILHKPYIHVHYGFVGVSIPHALTFFIARKSLLRNVSVCVILVVGHGRAVAQLLRYLRKVVGIVGVVYRSFHVKIFMASKRRSF